MEHNARGLRGAVLSGSLAENFDSHRVLDDDTRRRRNFGLMVRVAAAEPWSGVE